MKIKNNLAVFSIITIFFLTTLDVLSAPWVFTALFIKTIIAILLSITFARISNPLTESNSDMLIKSGWIPEIQIPSNFKLGYPEYSVLLSFLLFGLIEYSILAFYGKLDFGKELKTDYSSYLNSMSIGALYFLCLNIAYYFSFKWKDFTIESISFFILVTLTVYPHFNIFITLVILAAQHYLVIKVRKASLNTLIWKSSYWKNDQTNNLLEYTWGQDLKTAIWQKLSKNQFMHSISLSKSIILSSFTSWLFYVLSKTYILLKNKPVSEDAQEIVALFLLYPLLFVVPARILPYILGFHPPISFIARIQKCKLIIPSYDKIFISPICTILCYFLSIQFLPYIGPSNAIALGIFGIVFSATAIGPDFETWFYTGNYTVVNKEVSKLSKSQMRNIQQRDKKSSLEAFLARQRFLDKIL